MNKMHIRYLVDEMHQAEASTSHSLPQLATAVEEWNLPRRDEVKNGFRKSSKADVADGAVSEDDSEAASPAGESFKSFEGSETKNFACSKCGKQFAKARVPPYTDIYSLSIFNTDSNAVASFSYTPWSTAMRNLINVKSAGQRSSLPKISNSMARPIQKCGLMSVPIAVQVLSGEAH
ncbi:hypothetical protein HDU81_007210 [Chytriomyces hyalinus]|nr:hypothetical protein HDU81_007210 [Chytriomyces hyalinus]